MIIDLEANSKVNKVADPTKAGHSFIDWYQAEHPYDFDHLVNEDIILIAKWAADAKGCPKGYQVYQGKCRKQVAKMDGIKTCDSGYSLSGTSCIKTISIAASASCAKDYELINGFCRKGTWDNGQPTCKDGYSYLPSRSACWCHQYTYTEKRTCSGVNMFYNINDRKCYKYVKRIGPRDPRVCDSPTILINSYGDYICADPTTAAYPITCPSKGDNYTAKTDQIDHYCTYHDLIPYIRTCRAGDERINNKCYESTKYNANYSCTSGYTLSGTKCTKAETSTVKYSCPAGYELQINTCYKYDIKAMK